MVAGKPINMRKAPSITPGVVPSSIQEEHIATIADGIDNATPYQWMFGTLWYPVFSWMIENVSPLPKQTSLGLFAVLSPQRYVYHNWDAYMESLSIDPWDIRTLFLERFKVAGIIGTDEPEMFLSGDKVEAFYANLSGDYYPATIDRHAASFALGKHVTGGIGPKMYAYLQLCYQFAAFRLGILPAQGQAIAWKVQKDRKASLNNTERGIEVVYKQILSLLLAYILVLIKEASKGNYLLERAA